MKSPNKQERKERKVHKHKWFESYDSCPCCGYEEQYCKDKSCTKMRSRTYEDTKWLIQD